MIGIENSLGRVCAVGSRVIIESASLRDRGDVVVRGRAEPLLVFGIDTVAAQLVLRPVASTASVDTPPSPRVMGQGFPVDDPDVPNHVTVSI